MIANHIIESSIEELTSITKTGLCVFDCDGNLVAATCGIDEINQESIKNFAEAEADSQVIAGDNYYKVEDGESTSYVLVAKGDAEHSYTVGRIAVSQLQALIKAYKERYDSSNFIQNLLMDNLLLVDIYNQAKKLRIPASVRRCVFSIEVESEEDTVVLELLKGLFIPQNGDYAVAVNEKCIVLVKSLEENEGYEELENVSRQIVDTLNAEAMVNVRVSYGTLVYDLKDVSRSYKESQMALEVGRIFYTDKRVVAYNTLGIGRLVYQLPSGMCDIFMKEIFDENVPTDFDEETLSTINQFFENNLNVSETARKLFIHRNTLVYRIEKLKASTGLDIRIFEDALTFKIALMVSSYMDYLKKQE